jgi:soluble lytic murein transglycosylase-like protein
MKQQNWLVAAFAVLLLFISNFITSHETSGLREQNAILKVQNAYLVYHLDDIVKTSVSTADCDARIRNALIQTKIEKANPHVPKNRAAQLATAFSKYSDEYNLDVDLLIAIAREESEFDPKAVSTVGAMGIMQVMPFWSADLEWVGQPSELFDIDKNIHAGAYILRQYLDMFQGNKRMALLAYNRGPGTVINRIHNGESPDNGYATLVLASYRFIQQD